MPSLRRLCLLPLSALLFAFPATAASVPEELVARVVDLMIQDDPGKLDAAVSQEDNLRGTMEEFECINVTHASGEVLFANDQRIRMRIEVDGKAIPAGGKSGPVPIPPVWFLTAERNGDQWQLVRLLTEERYLGKQMLASTPEAAECLFATATHPKMVVEQYADVIDDASDHERMLHARALAESLGDPRAMIAVLRLEATLLARTRSTDPEAIAIAKEALRIAKSDGTPDDVADATFTLAVAYMLHGDLQIAMDVFGEAEDMHDKVDHPIMCLKALHMRSWIANGQGQLREVLRASEKMMTLSRRYHWVEGEIGALFQASNVHGHLGNDALSESYQDEAYQLAVSSGDRANLLRLDFNRASALHVRGHSAEALRRVQEQILPRLDVLVQPSEKIEVLATMASMYGELGRYDEADKALDKADAIARSPIQTTVAGRSVLELQRGRYDKAIEYARRWIELEKGTLFDMLQVGHTAFALAVIGRAYRRSGRPEEAIEALRSSLSADEQFAARMGVLRPPLAIDRMPAYVDLIELLVERKDTREALRVAERMRARKLRDVLEHGYVDLSATMTQEERDREAAMDERLGKANRERLAAWSAGAPSAELDAELDAARTELDRFRQEMRIAHPTVAQRQPVTASEPRVPPSVTAVEYVVADTQTIAFLIDGDRVTAVPIAVSSTELDRRTNEFTSLMAGRSPGYRAAARRMYDLLVAPLEKHLDVNKTLCVIPDGPLWSIPFHALVAKNGKFVIDQRPLFYASSLALLNGAMERAPHANGSLIAFGNPQIGSNTHTLFRSLFRDVTLGSLEDAEKEAKEVSRMYGLGSRAYVRDRALESVFKSEAPGFGVVHVAAHAIVDDRAPMYSAIVLAAPNDDSRQDGLLEGREVADLRLDAELAVLSACDTARGKAGYGEGVIGLGWAFQAAGTPTLVVSQWQVESRVTSELMIEFHRRLRAGATIADALRQAQLSVRRRHPHPFYWAPFVAVGAAAKPLSSLQH